MLEFLVDILDSDSQVLQTREILLFKKQVKPIPLHAHIKYCGKLKLFP